MKYLLPGLLFVSLLSSAPAEITVTKETMTFQVAVRPLGPRGATAAAPEEDV